MKHAMIVAGSFMTLVASASAEGVTECNDATIEFVLNGIATIVDGQNSEKTVDANIALDEAKEARMNGNMEDCIKHLNSAMHVLKGE